MTKRTATRWYIGAWAAAALAVWALAAMDKGTTPGTSPAGASLAELVIFVGTIVMFVTWTGTLISLAHRRAWGWFAAVALTQLLFVGVAGMVGYAIADRPDMTEVVIRPAVT